MKVKNVSGGPRWVPLLGREVADGEIAEVPETQPGHTEENPLPIVWPEATWEPVSDPAPDKPAAKAALPAPVAADDNGKAAS